ncbi:MAG: transporter substrate-binding domain-containing protein [Nitrospirae bacterium]|nr:transporter substrate-binding domain-containing protein [Nitrospirota bacterium]
MDYKLHRRIADTGEAAAGLVGKFFANPLRTSSFLVLLVLYICISLIPLSVSAHDLADVQRSGVLRHLGIPYANFVTGSGDGMDVEIMKLFARYLGVQYQYVKTDWDSAIGDLTGSKVEPKGGGVEILGKVQVKGDLIADGMTVLPWRREVVDFSEPTFANQVWLIARSDSPLKPIKPSNDMQKDMAAVRKLLKNRTLLCKAKTCLDPSLYNLETAGARLRYFEGSLNEMVPALLNRKAELTLLDVPDALVALQKWPGKIKVIGPISAMQEMAVAFRKDSPGLRDAFNKFLGQIRKDGTYRHIVDKYYPFALDYYPAFFRDK